MKKNSRRQKECPALLACPATIEKVRGRRFGKLTVIGFAGNKTKFGQNLAVCACDCGWFVSIPPFRLRTGNTTSCGCVFSDTMMIRNSANATHGATKGRQVTVEYRAWRNMLSRCNNSNDARYKWYGARGIKVCSRWEASFENFVADVGLRPCGLSLERKDNDKGYDPDNVIWASAKTQARNQRNSVKYAFREEEVTLGELADRFSIDYDILRQRVERHKWPLEQAIGVPVGKGGRYPTQIKPFSKRLRAIWHEIKGRCLNPKHPRYESYGGRGITICTEWASSFESFLENVGIPPNELCSLDRKNNDGNYEPSNIRWTTSKEQNRNRRSTKRYELYGKERTLSEWAELAGLPYERVKQRVLTYKWPLAEALGTPISGGGRMAKADRKVWTGLGHLK